MENIKNETKKKHFNKTEMSKPTVEPNKLKWQQKLILLVNVLSICPLWGVNLKLDLIKMSVTVSVF